MSAPVLALADAAFGYGGVVAVHADLRAEAGEVVALVGSNGSGKSSLIKGALGLIDCYRGEVAWFGRPVRKPDHQPVVGYVPQRQPSTSPIPSTVEELVLCGRITRTGMRARRRSVDRIAVAEAIKAVGLQRQHHALVRELSGGQQRRALVARALAGQPTALVLDEPFAGVDDESQELLAASFRQLAHNGVSLILALHELGPLDGVVTRVVHLTDGTVVFDGAPEHRPAALVRPDAHGVHCDETQGVGQSRFGLFQR